jgi:hypothetical protein
MNNIMNTVIWIATFVLGSLGSVFKSCMRDINTHFFYQLHIPVTAVIPFTLTRGSFLWLGSKTTVEVNKLLEIILQGQKRLMPHETNDVMMAT